MVHYRNIVENPARLYRWEAGCTCTSRLRLHSTDIFNNWLHLFHRTRPIYGSLAKGINPADLHVGSTATERHHLEMAPCRCLILGHRWYITNPKRASYLPRFSTPGHQLRIACEMQATLRTVVRSRRWGLHRGCGILCEKIICRGFARRRTSRSGFYRNDEKQVRCCVSPREVCDYRVCDVQHCTVCRSMEHPPVSCCRMGDHTPDSVPEQGSPIAAVQLESHCRHDLPSMTVSTPTPAALELTERLAVTADRPQYYRNTDIARDQETAWSCMWTTHRNRVKFYTNMLLICARQTNYGTLESRLGQL